MLEAEADAAGGEEPADPETLSARYLRRAAGGDAASLGWLVERLDPCLHAAARHQLGGELAGVCEPQDLVHEVWLITLGRLAELGSADGASTRRLLAFMCGCLRNRVNNLIRKHVRAARAGTVPGAERGAPRDFLERFPAEVTGVTTAARLSELRARLEAALDELEPADREVILLRAFEQRPNREVALLLGLAPGTVAVRLHRALARLRERLGDSVLDELG